jgi:uncharacterized protein (TIGR03086 family)
MLDLRPAASELTRVLDGITDDHLDGPTPCPGYSVGALLDHVSGLTLVFTWAAEKSTAKHAVDGGPAPGGPTAAHLDPTWREVLPERLATLAAAWDDPAAWQGISEAGGVTMPSEVTGLVALDELVLHGWDLATATGQDFRCAQADAEAVLAFASQTADDPAARQGLFGPVVAVPADAPTFDRALGMAGREPSWRP